MAASKASAEFRLEGGWFGLWGIKASRALVRSAVGLHARILVWDPYQPGLSNRGVVRMLVETTNY